MAEQVLLLNRRPDRPLTLDEYRAQGGYQALMDTVGKRSPEEVLQAVLDAKLKGRGGAWFPTGKKWSFIGKGHPRYIVPNSDEMEPGTFKDRVLVNANPHLVLEGIILAAYAIAAAAGPVLYPAVLRDGRPAHRAGTGGGPGRRASWGRTSWGATFPSTWWCTGAAGAISAGRPRPRWRPSWGTSRAP